MYKRCISLLLLFLLFTYLTTAIHHNTYVSTLTNTCVCNSIGKNAYINTNCDCQLCLSTLSYVHAHVCMLFVVVKQQTCDYFTQSNPTQIIKYVTDLSRNINQTQYFLHTCTHAYEFSFLIFFLSLFLQSGKTYRRVVYNNKKKNNKHNNYYKYVEHHIQQLKLCLQNTVACLIIFL